MSQNQSLFNWKLLAHAEDQATYEVYFDPSHFIYQAHFPTQPVTPGVCIIQLITELASALTTKKLQLRCAKNVKFLSLLIPSLEESVLVELKMEHEQTTATNLWHAKAVVKNAQSTIAKLSLVYDC